MSDGPSVYELMDGTSAERNLAEDYVALLDKLSALTGAVESGNWYYAFEKIDSVRSRLADLERRISTKAEEDGEACRAFAAPDVDPHRVRQLIIAFAQQHGGYLGPKMYPVEELENEQAKAKIAESQQWLASFRAAVDADDETAASQIAGSQVKIVHGMTSNG